jgi:hypothetical protein
MLMAAMSGWAVEPVRRLGRQSSVRGAGRLQDREVHRAELRARLAGDRSGAEVVDQQLAAYAALAPTIEPAPTADAVRTVVTGSGLARGADPVVDAVAASET